MTREAAGFRGLRTAAAALGVCVGYYVGAHFGFLFWFPPMTPSVMWPPNAILTTALLLAPPRHWWIYLFAALPAHLAAELGAGWPTSLVLILFVTNCSEALFAACCVRWLSDTPTRFDTLRRVVVFIIAAVIVAPFLSSFLDAAAVAAVQREPYWSVWDPALLQRPHRADHRASARHRRPPWERLAPAHVARPHGRSGVSRRAAPDCGDRCVHGIRRERHSFGANGNALCRRPTVHALGRGSLRPRRRQQRTADDGAAVDLGRHPRTGTARHAADRRRRAAAPDFSDHDRDPAHVPGRADRGAPASGRHTGRAATLRTDTLEPLRVVREPAWSLDGRRVRDLAATARRVSPDRSRPALPVRRRRRGARRRLYLD